MPPLPLKCFGTSLSPACRVQSLAGSEGTEKKLPSISSSSVPADRMHEFSTASADVHLQVQCCSFPWKTHTLKGSFCYFHITQK